MDKFPTSTCAWRIERADFARPGFTTDFEEAKHWIGLGAAVIPLHVPPPAAKSVVRWVDPLLERESATDRYVAGARLVADESSRLFPDLPEERPRPEQSTRRSWLSTPSRDPVAEVSAPEIPFLQGLAGRIFRAIRAVVRGSTW